MVGWLHKRIHDATYQELWIEPSPLGTASGTTAALGS